MNEFVSLEIDIAMGFVEIIEINVMTTEKDHQISTIGI